MTPTDPAEQLLPRRDMWLLIGLTLLFIAVWQAPPLRALHGVEIMPLWLHTLMETFAISIAVMTFGVVWNAHSRERAGNLVILACAFLATGLIDFAHTMSYRGMPDFITPSGVEKGINFWLAARLTMAVALLAVALRPWRPFAWRHSSHLLLLCTLAATALVWWLGLWYPEGWPHTFIEGQGLTGFKIGAEYFIVALMAIAALIFYVRSQRKFHSETNSLVLATSVSILSELCFTLYSDVTDLMNLLGHIYKVIAYFFFYRAIFVSCINQPFRKLQAETDAHRKTAQALAESARYQEELLAHLPAAVVVHGPDTAIRYCNKEALRLLGLDESAALGKTVDASNWRFLAEDGTPLPPERYPASLVLVDGKPLRDYTIGYLPDAAAQPTWAQANAFPYCAPDGRISEVVVSFIDITARRNALLSLQQAEASLTSLNEQLEQRVAKRTHELEIANKELEAFSYSVSHDLRAPLRSIDGFSQVLLQRYGEQFDDTGRDYLLRVRRASQRMGELIDDLLQLSRLTRGALRRQEVDLSVLAEAVLQECQRAEPERKVAVTVRPGMHAYGDPGLLRALLDNLLGNAWKFTRHTASAAIEFGCETGADGLVYFVRDNGAGFNNDYAHKLFQVFQRLHSTEEFEGTGIGLATVSRIIQRHHGSIRATGEPGKGATFYFSLPQRTAERDDATDTPTQPETP